MKLRWKILCLLMVIKQVRGKGRNPVHVAPEPTLFLTMSLRISTGRSLYGPVLRWLWLRKENTPKKMSPSSTWVFCCRCTKSCGSPSVSFFDLTPSYGTEVWRVLGLEPLIFLERFVAIAKWGVGGWDAEGKASRGKQKCHGPRSNPEIFDLCLPP